MKYITKAITLILITSCVSCATSNKTTSEVSLYQKLGGKPAIEKIVNNLINVIGHDEIIFAHFAQSNVSHFKKSLSVYLCHISDGPCQYKGDTLEDIHRGMNINKNEFNHFVELFISALDASDINQRVQNLLLARLAPTRKNIINI